MSDDQTQPTRTRFRDPAGAARTESAPDTTVRRTATKAPAAPVAVVEPAAVPEPAVARPRRWNALTVVATALAVVLLAATVVFAVLWVNARNDADEQADTRRSVLATAQKVAVDLSSYDYRRLDSDFRTVAAQLTPSFRKSYSKTAAALKATLTQYQAIGTAKPFGAGVSTLSQDKATVIVFLDQKVTGKVSSPVVHNFITVSLQRSGDRWLASKVDVVSGR